MNVKDKKFEPKATDVIREEVITEYGLDPENDDNKEFIDKLTAEREAVQSREMDHHKKLNQAIQQKIKARGQKESDGDDEDGDDETPKEKQIDKKSEIDTSNFVTKDDLQRMKYPNLSDEEYTSINALAKAEGKSFEDTIENNPIAKTYFESSEARERLSNVSKPPSTRSSKVDIQSEEDKIADDLSSDLPEGFTVESKSN
jgi:hypothetical protein